MFVSTTSNLSLNTPRDSDATISLGNPFQCLTTLSEKKCLIISSLNLLWHNLRPFPLDLSLAICKKRLTPSSSQLWNGGGAVGLGLSCHIWASLKHSSLFTGETVLHLTAIKAAIGLCCTSSTPSCHSCCKASMAASHSRDSNPLRHSCANSYS